MSQERWAVITGFPNYAVSTHGRVWNTRLDKEVNPYLDSYGYAKVHLHNSYKNTTLYVHRLVAHTFIGRLPGNHRVKHKDNDRGNNAVENLYIPEMTRAVRVGVPNVAKPQRRKLEVIELGETYGSVAEFCRHYPDADASSVYKVLRGIRPNHMELTFRYIYE